MQNVINQWDKAAKRYCEFEDTSIYSNFCREFIAHHFKGMCGKRILDAGCGNGAFTHAFAQNGNMVTGCDGSGEMLNIARERYPGCRFDRVDLLRGTPYGDEEFDMVFCNLVLMDLDPIDRVLAEFHRILKNKGILFFSIVHPAFYRAEWERDEHGAAVSRKVKGYITPISKLQDIWGETMLYHRPISYYYNKVTAAGFSLKEMFEPPVYEDEKIPDIPLYLFSEFVRTNY